MTIELSGRIDSTNASKIEEYISERLKGYSGNSVVLDAAGLEYISSAGLRVILHLRKEYSDLKLINVNPDVYLILEMTGFTEMMTIEKAYRVVSVEGCEEIGRGANGTIYRIDKDNVVKVYNNPDALDDIKHEREVAKLALILGIPTAISYDIVRVGNSYGSVFELLNAKSFSKILSSEPEKMDWCVKEYVGMLNKIHGTVVPKGKLPDLKETVISWAEFVRGYLPKEAGDKLVSLVEAVPQNDHMIHGDYHTKNIELQNDEVLIIDMDTLAVGDPIFELGSMFNAFIGFSETDHDHIKEFQGFDYETSCKFWHKTLSCYLGTECETKIHEVENKARIVGYTRLIRRSIRRNESRENTDHWMDELLSLLETTDTLVFERNELDIAAEVDNLPEVQRFVKDRLAAAGCGPRIIMQTNVAVEEIFVNIANYAYAPKEGMATVRIEVGGDPLAVSIMFIDGGKPFDPLAMKDPDITLPAEERNSNDLGIFIAKNVMDDVGYEYKNGKNILTIKKNV